jgi:hypothetical protein
MGACLISVSKALSFRAWAAAILAILCVAALAAASAGTPAASAPDAGEIPDEKGRTPSSIAAEQRQEQANAERIQARKDLVQEERRRAVSVPSDANECLAYHRSERRCLVTVGEFNRRLEDDGQWVEGGGDSVLQTAQLLEIRKRLLASLLQERYADALVGGQDEAGIQAEEAWRANLAGLEASVGEEKLHALYRKHAAAFGPRREVQAEFLGASDSSFLDSLVQSMIDPPQADPPQAAAPRKNAAPGKDDASRRLYLWGKLQPGDLPEVLPRVTRNIRQGEISEIIRGRFGWFVVAAARVVDIPAKTYEESRPLLAHMAGIPEASAGGPAGGPGGKGAGGKKPSAVPGREKPDAEPARPEDPVVRVWLMPRAAPGKGKKPYPPAWSDTGLVSALRLRLSDLPAGVGCEAAAHLRRNGGGISQTRFGTWYFRAGESPSVAMAGQAEPCGVEIETARSEPDPFSMAAEYLASKEKEFKRSILEARRDATGSGPRDESSLRAKWVAENVTLANNVLKRF